VYTIQLFNPAENATVGLFEDLRTSNFLNVAGNQISRDLDITMSNFQTMNIEVYCPTTSSPTSTPVDVDATKFGIGARIRIAFPIVFVFLVGGSCTYNCYKNKYENKIHEVELNKPDSVELSRAKVIYV